MAEWDGRFFREYIKAFEYEFTDASSRMARLKKSHQIDYAVGEDLDKLGAIYNLNRFTGETDNEYRNRVKSYLPSHQESGTKTAFKTAFEVELGYVVTTQDIAPIPTVEVLISVFSFPYGDLTTLVAADVNDVISRVKAAGVNGTYSFWVPIGFDADEVSNSVEETPIKIQAETVLISSGAAGFWIWDISLWDSGDLWAP